YGSLKCASSRLAEMYHIAIFWPFSISTPPKVTSRVRVRRMCRTGLAHRTISSAAVIARPSRSCSHRRFSSGNWVIAQSPWLIALRVVSLPAAISSRMNGPRSSGGSASPSSSAWTRVLALRDHPRREAAIDDRPELRVLGRIGGDHRPDADAIGILRVGQDLDAVRRAERLPVARGGGDVVEAGQGPEPAAGVGMLVPRDRPLAAESREGAVDVVS